MVLNDRDPATAQTLRVRCYEMDKDIPKQPANRGTAIFM